MSREILFFIFFICLHIHVSTAKLGVHTMRKKIIIIPPLVCATLAFHAYHNVRDMRSIITRGNIFKNPRYAHQVWYD